MFLRIMICVIILHDISSSYVCSRYVGCFCNVFFLLLFLFCLYHQLDDAERTGKLKPGGIVIEATG